MGKKSTVFVKTIKGTFSGNLGNLWELGKTKYEMLDNSSKKTVKSDFVFAGRPMITKSTKTQAPRLFGFESPLYLDPDSHERLINAVPADVLDTEEAPFLQFVHSAASWIRGYKLSEAKNGEIDPEYHPKLGRAHRISVRDPQLRYQVRVDDDGTKYKQYFLSVHQISQVAPERNLEIEAPTPDSIFRSLKAKKAKKLFA